MWFFKRKPKPARSAVPVTLHAKYDAAQTTADNIRHWVMADGLSADAAASRGEHRGSMASGKRGKLPPETLHG